MVLNSFRADFFCFFMCSWELTISLMEEPNSKTKTFEMLILTTSLCIAEGRSAYWPINFRAEVTYNQYYINVYIIVGEMNIALQLSTPIKVARLDGLW